MTQASPNAYISYVIAQSKLTVSMIDGEDDNNGDHKIVDSNSRTDLDSHANMVVLGRHARVIAYTGKTAQVSPFTPEYKSLEDVPIVDGAITYECPYSGHCYVLLCHNALYVPSMLNNLIPPFIMREAGVIVNDTPKIHVDQPTKEHHSLYFKEENLRIPLSLHGIFSYFPSRSPSTQDISNEAGVMHLTPNVLTWNPHSEIYSKNEENMMDFEGSLTTAKKVLISDLEDDDAMVAMAHVSSAETNAIDICVFEEYDQPPNDIDIDIRNVSPILDAPTLSQLLQDRATCGKFAMSIGSTDVHEDNYLFNDSNIPDTSENSDKILDEIMISATHAMPPKGVTAQDLSKVWRIDLATAKRTLQVTTQLQRRKDDPSLTRNYKTNDRMLRYKRIKEFFWMDTLFATKNGGKSSRGNYATQLFVTDRGYVCVIPMKSESEVSKALKIFAKTVGAPEAIICDSAKAQKSNEVRQFLTSIGTSLRLLETGTPWSNRAELYVGLMKSATCKDMKEAGCPLPFWDYCIERRARINNLTAKDLFQLEGRNPQYSITGEEGDISNLCQFKFYEWCYFFDARSAFPNSKEILGRVLGPSTGEGNEMAQWILKANGEVVPRRTLRSLKPEEIHSPIEQKKRDLFDELITCRWGTSLTPPLLNLHLIKNLMSTRRRKNPQDSFP